MPWRSRAPWSGGRTGGLAWSPNPKAFPTLPNMPPAWGHLHEVSVWLLPAGQGLALPKM